jgi:hypothetical protein
MQQMDTQAELQAPLAPDELRHESRAVGALPIINHFLVLLGLPQAGTEAGPQKQSLCLAATVEKPMKEKTPRVDWAELLSRTFALDVFACVRCGGRRRVLAYVTAPSGVRSILEHLGLPTRPAKLAPAQGPPQSAWC